MEIKVDKEALYEKAFKELPGGAFDPFIHKNIDDLCWIVLHELDLLIEETPEIWEYNYNRNMNKLNAAKNKFIRYLEKYHIYMEDEGEKRQVVDAIKSWKNVRIKRDWY